MARGRRGIAQANEAALTRASQTLLEALNSLEELRSRQCLTSFLDSWLDPFSSANGMSRLECVEEWCSRRMTDARDAQLAQDRARRAEERDEVRRRREQEAERRREQQAERRREQQAERRREEEEERLREQQEAEVEEEGAETLRVQREEERRRQQQEEEAEAEILRVQREEERRQQQEKEAEAETLRVQREEERRQQQEKEAEAETLRVQREEERRRVQLEGERRQQQEKEAEAERLHEQQVERLREQDKVAERTERDAGRTRQQEEHGPLGSAPQQVDDVERSRSGNRSQEANEEGTSGGDDGLLEDSVGDNASAANNGGKNSSLDSSGANSSQRGGGPNSGPQRTDGAGGSKLLHATGLIDHASHEKEVSQGLHPPHTPNSHSYPFASLGLATPSQTPLPSSNKRQGPPGLLRLTSSLSGKDVIQRTMALLESGPDRHELTPDKAKHVRGLFESIFSVKAWWELHCCMKSYVGASAFYKAETQEDSDRRDSIASLASSVNSCCVGCSSSPGPGQYYLKDFVQQWQSLRHFSNNTLKPALTNMKMMRYEEHLFVYWQRLLQVWTSYHIPRENNNNNNSKGDVEDDEPMFELDHSPDEADHLMTILHEQLEARKCELGCEQPHAEIAHTSMLLKRLVAPLLGFRVADENFHKLFSNTLLNGKSVFTLTRHLGPGAIAIVRKGILRKIGAKSLNQILPQLTTDHPSLRKCLDTVNEIFLNPLSQGKQLDYDRVGTFLKITSKDELFKSCERHEGGLSELFSSEDPLTEWNIEPESGSLGFGTTNALTGDVEERNTNNRPEYDVDEEPVFDIRELLAEEGRRGATTRPSGTRDADGTRGASGQGDGPTTPPTTGQKRSRDADRATPESPSKRRG
ncbi:MAG: hypothetical protein Q9192_001281 [Flavoplaca navasiana]